MGEPKPKLLRKPRGMFRTVYLLFTKFIYIILYKAWCNYWELRADKFSELYQKVKIFSLSSSYASLFMYPSTKSLKLFGKHRYKSRNFDAFSECYCQKHCKKHQPKHVYWKYH